MKAHTAYSLQTDTAAAVHEISVKLPARAARLLLFFSSPVHDATALATAFARAFPGVPAVGCTTAGEIVTGRMLEHSLVAMVLGDELIQRVAVQPVLSLAGDTVAGVHRAFESFARKLGCPMAELNPEKHVGLVLADGLSGAEEHLMDALGDGTNVTFLGGSAGDDLRFRRTHVFVDGQAYTDAAALAVIEVATAFDIVKTQSFNVLPKTLVATKVDEARRLVLEFNSRPAVEAYAAALNVTPAGLPALFMTHPLGLVIEGDAYVRSPQRIEGSGVYFYCSILEGTELSLLESTDIVADTARAMAHLQPPLAVVNFNCILRTLELRQKGQCDAYAGLFAEVPTVGFSTYGEAYLGHINQTATLLSFHAA